MLVLNRTAPADSQADPADRRNEIVLTLPDGRRVAVFLHTKYTARGGSRLRVVIDAPRDVLVDRGEVADGGR
ncbi:unnamed protein product [Gemmataceae bacterium]|nr:unnamed protein product [Gemmataceae bacterium]VTT98898.1 unnamed protein product [Gemmataceae bacterium]